MTKQASRIPEVPENLKQLLAGDHSGYHLKTVYFLQLDHTLWGFFPAVVRGTDRVVMALDPALLKKVWERLTPRKSKMSSNLSYVNEGLMVGFPILETDEPGQKSSEPEKLLTEKEFEELATGNASPFQWAPGLVSNDMTKEEFLETIQAAAKTHGVKLPA